MIPENVPGDALVLKLGVLQVSAYGNAAIMVVAGLALLMLVSHWLKRG